jgi:hypothetical protein
MKSYISKITVLPLLALATLLGFYIFLSFLGCNEYSNKQITNAFFQQNESVESLKLQKQSINKSIYGEFEMYKMIYKSTFYNISEYYNKAQIVKNSSDSVINEIEKIKVKFIADVDNTTEEKALSNNYLLNEDGKWLDTDLTNLFFENSNDNRAAKIESIMNNHIAFLVDKFETSYNDSIFLRLRLVSNSYTNDKNWPAKIFKDQYPILSLYEINKMQYDLREMENLVIQFNLNKLKSQSYKFEKIGAVVIPEKYILKKGETFNAQILLNAYNISERPEIIINGNKIDDYRNGKGIYSEKATAIGMKKIKGYIVIYSYKNGERIELPFETEYEVVP